MSLHQFQLFVSFAKHSNVTQLAQQLHISQSAISQQLRRLRDEFGVDLFKKNGRGSELTEIGRAFRQDVESILSQIADLKTKYKPATAGNANAPLVLAASHGPSAVALPFLMILFKEQHPSTEIEFKACASPEVQELVLKSEVELAVITNPSPSPVLEMEPFREFKLCVFVAAHHPLAKRKEMKPEELTPFPLIIGRTRKGPSGTADLLGSLTAKGVKPHVLMRCESPDVLRAVVRKTQALGIYYQDAVEEAVRLKVFKILRVKGLDLTVRTYIIYLREKPLSQTAREFLALLRTARKIQSFINDSRAPSSLFRLISEAG